MKFLLLALFFIFAGCHGYVDIQCPNCPSGGMKTTLTDVPPSEFDCSFITHAKLTEALAKAVCNRATKCDAGFGGKAGLNGGLDTNMWATVVNRAGRVCAVTYSGPTINDQWLGSRAISAEKANTVNNFCLPQFAMSTANLYQSTNPGGSLYGLQHTNPVHHENMYNGATSFYGNPCDAKHPDPTCSEKPGGVVIFGGGLGLYNSKGELVGGLGVSGDMSCSDHAIAWKTRFNLDLDYVPAGPNKQGQEDNIIYPETATNGHPVCTDEATHVAKELAKSYPTHKATGK